MQLPVVLDVCDRKNLLGKKFSVKDVGNICPVSIKKTKSAVKKVAYEFRNRNILISNKVVNMNIFNGRIKECPDISFNMILKLIKKICKALIQKYSKEWPMNELIIAAKNEEAYPLIEELQNISKLFTIISDNENRRMADEMYFKYGCVIRHKISVKEIIEDNNFILCSDERILTEASDSIILNMTHIYSDRENVVNIRDITINDKRFSDLVTYWNGSPGIEVYNILGVLPDNNANIEMNKKADKIFLLDIDAF